MIFGRLQFTEGKHLYAPQEPRRSNGDPYLFRFFELLPDRPVTTGPGNGGHALLVCDELGYLSYDSRYADLLFEVVTRRYQQRSTIITTNKVFSEWNQVFPNAASVVTIIDRLVHKSEIITIEGASYSLKEAKERAAQKARNRKQRSPKR